MLSLPSAPQQLGAVVQGFRYPSGDQVLLEVVEEGRAVEVMGGKVRPGAEYILVQRRDTQTGVLQTTTVRIGCPGVTARRFRLADHVTGTAQAVLRQLGLSLAKHVRLWPVGLGAAVWDGEGYCEVLVDEPLALQVAIDHEISSLRLEIDGAIQIIHVATGDSAGSVLLEVDSLEQGTHHLRVGVQQGRETKEIGELTIAVRQPGSTGRTRALTGAVVMYTVPLHVTLEALWDQTAEISIAGPPGIKAECHVALHDSTSAQPLARTSFVIPLPCGPVQWRSIWKERVVEKERFTEQYDRSSSCLVVIDAGSLGRRTLTARREVSPMRWHVTARGDELVATLLSDMDGPPGRVEYYSFEAPDHSVNIPVGEALNGRVISGKGALMAAFNGDLSAITVAACRPKKQDLKSLAISTVLEPLREDVTAIVAYLRSVSLWLSAHTRGSRLGPFWRSQVLHQMLLHLSTTIAGRPWTEKERTTGSRAGEIDEAGVAHQPDVVPFFPGDWPASPISG